MVFQFQIYWNFQITSFYRCSSVKACGYSQINHSDTHMKLIWEAPAVHIVPGQ